MHRPLARSAGSSLARTFILLLIAVFTVLIALPADRAAAAPCAPDPNGLPCVAPVVTHKIYADQRPTYKGWARLDEERCFANLTFVEMITAKPSPYCITNTVADANGMVRPNIFTWKWSANGWTAGTQHRAGAQVYVWPFGSGWSWIWTSASGWNAVPSKFVMVSDGMCYYESHCPMF